MDRTILGYELLPAQIQAMNPFLIIVLIPLFSYYIYPFMARYFDLTAGRKMCMGMFLAATPFLVTAWCESQIQLGHTPHISWQLLAYFLMTLAEVLLGDYLHGIFVYPSTKKHEIVSHGFVLPVHISG